MFRTVSLSITRSFFTAHTAYLYDMYHCCVYSEKLLMMEIGTVRNMQCFIPKNKFEKLVHLVSFITGELSETCRVLFQKINLRNQCIQLVLLQGNCTKHVEFYSKNKFEKLVHLVSFITEELYETCRVLFQKINLRNQCIWLVLLQRNCTKHVEFYSKNKFEKLVHLVGFILRKQILQILYIMHFPVCLSYN